MRLLLSFITLYFAFALFLAYPTFAEDKKESENTEQEQEQEQTAEQPAEGLYSPDFCDFEITFPEKPQTVRRCPNGSTTCYTLNGYTYVYDLTTTVDVTAICAPSTPESYKRYNESVIAAALKGMVTRDNIQNAQIDTKDDGDTRQGSVIGTILYGKQDTIYNAQLWVGKNSVLTVEAKLIGASHDKADKTFSDILASIKVKDKEKKKSESKDEASTTPAPKS